MSSVTSSIALAERAQTAISEQGWGLGAVEVADGGEAGRGDASPRGRDRAPDTTFAGFTGLAVPRFTAHFTPTVEVGWRLARPFWGHGYATEGARAGLAYAFGQLGLQEVVSFTTVANARSRRVMERLSMTHDPADDFDHPRLTASPLQRHVLYRLRAGQFRR